MSALSDEKLLPLIAGDDRVAFEELFLRYDSLLYSHAYGKFLNKHEAQDVVQEVFINLWQNRSLQIKTTIKGYLYNFVLDKVLDIFKHRTIKNSYANRFIEVDSKETDFLLREHELEDLIEKEIQAMPPKCGRSINLNVINAFPVKIAEQLDISEHTVNTQMKRALKHLRVKLGILVYLLYIIQ